MGLFSRRVYAQPVVPPVVPPVAASPYGFSPLMSAPTTFPGFYGGGISPLTAGYGGGMYGAPVGVGLGAGLGPVGLGAYAGYGGGVAPMSPILGGYGTGLGGGFGGLGGFGVPPVYGGGLAATPYC